jgi:hypothetical protein
MLFTIAASFGFAPVALVVLRETPRVEALRVDRVERVERVERLEVERDEDERDEEPTGMVFLLRNESVERFSRWAQVSCVSE